MKKLILKWLIGDNYEIVPKNLKESPRPNHQALIVDIMNEFDFDRVWSVMDHLNWKWGDPRSGNAEVPNLDKIKDHAKSLLNTACLNALESDGEEFCIQTGGFKASAHKENGKIAFLQLQFILTEWD